MPRETDIRPRGGASNRFRRLEVAVARMAEAQHGVVARSQLTNLGVSTTSIGRWVARGRLHRIYAAVYAVGHRKLSRQGWWMAAVLSGGPGSVLSHRPAGAAWNLRAWSGRGAITVPAWRRGPDAIDVHSNTLPADEMTALDGIPITSMPRTILDLATVLDHHDLTRVVEEAEHQRHTDPLSLPALIDRHRGRRGVGRLRAVLDSAGYGKGIAKPGLEERFLRFIAEFDLPHPELNATIRVGDRNYEADCVWRSERVIVELHSATFHGATPAVTRDATRDRHLLLAGWRVIHVTWAQLQIGGERYALAADLRAVLGGWRR